MKIVYALVFSVVLISCKKPDNNCGNIQNIYLSYNGPVTIGDTLKIYTQEVGGYRVYDWKGPNFFRSQDPRNTFYYAELEHEGWYYLTLSSNECNTKVDSIYVDIKLQQGNPSCAIPSNRCNFNNLADDTYSSVQKLYDPTTSFLTLQGRGSSTMEINFHHHWKTKEPEDGIYYTTNVPSFDGSYNKVFISTIKQSIYFSTQSNQKVYVSHVNGKLQVRFCNLTMSGSNGQISFTTLASGNLIQQ